MHGMTGNMLVYHVDLKRAMWRRDYLESCAGRLAGAGYNALLIEVEDKLIYPGHEAFAHPDAWSVETWQEVADSLRARGFELIPMVQTLAHAEYVLKHPGYTHLRENPDNDRVYNPLSDEVAQLLNRQLKCLVSTFRPERFIHIGGDEPRGIGRGRAAEFVSQHGVEELYLRHMNAMIENVVGCGLRPIIWGDIVSSHPRLLERFSREAVIADWEYHVTGRRTRLKRLWGDDGNCFVTADDYRRNPRPLLERYVRDAEFESQNTLPGFFYTDLLVDEGFDVLCCPANRAAGDNIGIANPRKHALNAFHFSAKARQRRQGILMTGWAVRHAHPETAWPGTLAAAPAACRDRDDRPRLYLSPGSAFEDIFPREDAARLIDWLSEKTPLTEAKQLLAAAEHLKAGLDPRRVVMDALAEVPKKPFSRMRPFTSEELRRRQADLRQAATLLKNALRDNSKDRHTLEFWIEGAVLLELYCRAMLAVIGDMPPDQRRDLRQRVDVAENNSRALFAKTYTDKSVAEEIALRYDTLKLLTGIIRD